MTFQNNLFLINNKIYEIRTHSSISEGFAKAISHTAPSRHQVTHPTPQVIIAGARHFVSIRDLRLERLVTLPIEYEACEYHETE